MQRFDFIVSYIDKGNCDIDCFKVSAIGWNQALVESSNKYLARGYNHNEVKKITIELVDYNAV